MFLFSIPRLKTHARLLLVLALTALALNIGPQASEAASTLVQNGSFEKNLNGWRTNKGTKVRSSSSEHDGAKAAVLTTAVGANAVLDDAPNTVRSAPVGTTYRLGVWVKTNVAGLSGQLRVREVHGQGVSTTGTSFWLTASGAWQRVELVTTTRHDGSSLDVSVLGWSMKKGQKLYVDTVSMVQIATPAPEVVEPEETTPAEPAKYALSNGSGLTERGVPLKGALFGATYGANENPVRFEQQLGQRLGVRRTFWAARQVDDAVKTARGDLAAGRLPWISFKLPYGWPNMSKGKGDAWAKDVATKLAKLPGPVWVAFHHEPEGDGDIQNWVKIQERLSPIVRSTAPNVAYTVIYTGYYQLYGPEHLHLKNVWPDTTVDVVGFDVYNQLGVKKNGSIVPNATPMRTAYFEKFEKFAASKGVAWGLAETAISDPASEQRPDLLRQTYDDLVATNGVAMAYFNTHLHSSSSWSILTPNKMGQYGDVLKTSPMFPKLV